MLAIVVSKLLQLLDWLNMGRITLLKLLSLLLISCITVNTHAQKTAKFADPAYDFKEALEIYDQKKYNIAFNRFYKFIETYEDLDDSKSQLLLADAFYYKASCASKQKDPKTEDLYLYYIDRFKGHSLNNRAYFDLGNWYFVYRDYKDALRYYKKVNERALNKKFYEEFSFKRGFCYFSLKQFDEAKTAWNEAINQKDSEYYEKANYYYGMASYFNEDYDDALASFEKATNYSRYRNVIPYYITQIKFIKSDYQGVIDYAVPVIEKKTIKNKSDINQLIGQSYFELGDFDAAVDYLVEYEGSAKKVTKEDYYQIGYAQYQTGDYAGAVKSFKELNHLNNALAQNALFLTGKAYLQLKDKEDNSRVGRRC